MTEGGSNLRDVINESPLKGDLWRRDMRQRRLEILGQNPGPGPNKETWKICSHGSGKGFPVVDEVITAVRVTIQQNLI